MSFQSRLGCWWVRLHVKQKPPGEAALVDFTRRRFRTPNWLVWLHSLGAEIERIESPVKGEWISARGGLKTDSVIYYLDGGGYNSGSAQPRRPSAAEVSPPLG